MKQIITHS